MTKSADDVLKEKREERGWDQDVEQVQENRQREQIQPLPLSNEEYQMFQLLLGKVALSDQNPDLCELYFELQRRAVYGNRYLQMNEMEDMERQLWEIGMGEQADNKESGKVK